MHIYLGPSFVQMFHADSAAKEKTKQVCVYRRKTEMPADLYIFSWVK